MLGINVGKYLQSGCCNKCACDINIGLGETFLECEENCWVLSDYR